MMRSRLYLAIAVVLSLTTEAAAQFTTPQFLPPSTPDSYWPEADQCQQFAQLADSLFVEAATHYCMFSKSARWSGKMSDYVAFCRSHNLGGSRAELSAMTAALNRCIYNKQRRVRTPSSVIGKPSAATGGASGLANPSLLDGDNGISRQGPAATGAPPGVGTGGGSPTLSRGVH